MLLLFGLVEYSQRFGFLRVGQFKFRWRRLLWWTSPLQVRWSLRRLRQISDHPYREWAALLWPWPRRWPCVLPPPPRVLYADPEAVTARYYRESHVQRQLPLWAMRDTPQRAFFRLYEATCAADDVMMGYATEYLFFRPEPEWALERLPDPRTAPRAAGDDANGGTDAVAEAERLAVMAWLAVSLEMAFNWRLELGLRRDGTVKERSADGTPAPWTPEVRPSWTHDIAAAPNLLVLSHGWEPDPDEVQDRTGTYNIITQRRGLRTV